MAGTSDHALYLVFPDDLKNPLNFSHTNGLPTDWVISLCEDQEGNLWAGTGGGGLVILHPSNIQTIFPAGSMAGPRGIVGLSPTGGRVVDWNRGRGFISLSRQWLDQL